MDETITPWDLRNQLEEEVRRQLIGPTSGETEVIDIDPRTKYLMGVLYPHEKSPSGSGQTLEVTSDADEPLYAEVLETVEEEPDDGPQEKPVATGMTFSPSSMGLTFTLSEEACELQLQASWGAYRRKPYQSSPESEANKKWLREPLQGVVHLPLQANKKAKVLFLTSSSGETIEDIEIHATIRRRTSHWVVTLFLINKQLPKRRLKSEACLFQTELKVSAPDGSPIFICHEQPHRLARLDEPERSEKETMNMLYRHQLEFAIGHGIAVHATPDKDIPQRATEVKTVALPSYEVPATEHIKIKHNEIDLETDMRTLSEMSSEQLQNALKILVKAYEHWIGDEAAKLQDPAQRLESYKTSAKRAIEQAELVQARIEEGIKVLANDPQAFEAFQLANRAMYRQRIRSLYALEQRRGNPQVREQDLDLPENRTWRPFQLAFILLNLPGLTQLDHPDRASDPSAIADLLWFPTGGGKTEAYLGLTAYVLFLRRLQGTVDGRNGHEGVAVLMRYTLRLLTLQQFQRAATLICACEEIRRTDPARWGATPFRIGLWVGRKTTPNTNEQSYDFIEALRTKGYPDGSTGSPVQLTNCPWCGEKIEADKHIRVQRDKNGGRKRTIIQCHGEGCIFNEPNEGLPTVVVDEELYHLLPSLVIATVDKFAQMPWNGDIHLLFGLAKRKCDRHGFISENDLKHPEYHQGSSDRTREVAHLRPIDLIIQDELHLISGPLGSMVGLYESAIEHLCSWNVNGKTVRPKIVLSTATIRRASHQVKQLFCHDVQIFPPHGLDVKDNFFSRQLTPSAKHPGRRYYGICAPGKKISELQIKVYTTLMAAAQQLYLRYGAAADPWMTLVGYYNTIRELGGARRLMADDIKAQLSAMEKQFGLPNRRINLMSVEELTSRVSSNKIPEILDHLEVRFNPQADGERLAIDKMTEAERPIKDFTRRRPVDALLATNMISVGVDISRLGLMAIVRQPKTTSEYIQASSRVGRSRGGPGMVFALYNWAHPRDLNHYEVFEHYHATFYKHVEALSVTPFSDGALDRGLAAVLIALIRLSLLEMTPNAAAHELKRTSPEIAEIVEALVKRADAIQGDQHTVDEVRHKLEYLLDEWLQLRDKEAGFGQQLEYVKSKGIGLLSSPEGRLGSNKPIWEPFTCQNSLRDVEPQTRLIIEKDRWLEPSINEHFQYYSPKKQGEPV